MTKKTSGYIDANGKYHKGIDVPLPHDVDTQFKQWSHNDQRKRMAADISQPYTSDGKPNPEFIDIYRGDVASKYFKQADIDAADRKLS